MKIFICGPTLYEKSHLGHARIFIFFNFLINYYKYLGQCPIAVVQLTDIDPKIFAKMRTDDNNVSLDNMTSHHLNQLTKDLQKLQVIENFTFTRVSNFQVQMMNQIINLLKLKKAYSYGGNVYLKIDSDIKSPFGFTTEELDNMPIDISSGKLDQKDIMLWNAENFYELAIMGDERSEFYFKNLVSGIPGWHYQDFQIIKSVFNNYYDIHGGAEELVYPHHEFIFKISRQMQRITQENEKKPKWIHVGILKIKSKKMSNSSGNTITISDFLNKYSPNSLKLLFLGEIYDNDFSFHETKLKNAILADNEISSYFISEFVKNGKITESVNESDRQKFSKFLRMLNNNYDTKSAIRYIIKCIRDLENVSNIKKMTDLLGLQYH
ncbi:putative Cysteine-tRNA ligase [Candidatus Nitrosocosmicus arcticus]|uniref:Putative Cysteine-tRNA ligase n=2 Tax=Candidatus Nitrosocosmicus arcticus TaxID=2035267 RepID=A0A557SVL4_9ARCH|nr:putative Cysteine-tRNA ligase [Candidatus Nitrosocosmicus arcticus]